MRRIIVQTEDGLRQMCNHLAARKEFSFDYEFKPMSWHRKPPLISCNFACHDSDGYTGYYVPLAHNRSDLFEEYRNYDGGQEGFLKTVKPLIENPRLRKVMHPSEIEGGISDVYGIDVGLNVDDTMIMSWLYDENPIYDRPIGGLYPHRLKEINKKCLGADRAAHRSFKSIKEMADGTHDISNARISEAAMYGTDDVIETLMLKEWFEPKLIAEGVYDAYRNVEIPIGPVIRNMVRTGIPLDLKQAQIQLDAITSYQSGLEKLIWEEAGEEFNLNARQQLARIMYEKLKYVYKERNEDGVLVEMDPPRTNPSKLYPGGQYKTADDVMEQLASLGYPVAVHYREYGDHEKFKTSYLNKFIAEAINGIYYQSYRQTGTKTGRSSGDFQQAPRKDKEKILNGVRISVRVLVIPHKGHWLICHHPDTKILTSDLRWIKASEVRKGDELIGFDEGLGRSCKYRRSKVQSVRTGVKPSFRIVTDKGVTTCSHDHQWVVRRHRPDRKADETSCAVRMWIKAEDLRPGDEITYFSDPWEADESFEAGYLAGFFDGEGWVSHSTVGFGQREGALWDHVVSVLDEKGFESGSTSRRATKTRKGKSTVLKQYLKGDKAGIKFIGSIRPQRLLANSPKLWEGRRTWSSVSQSARVLSVESVGDQPVVAIQTSTRTMIADGMLSHNCADYNQLELRLLAHFSMDPALVGAYVRGEDLHQGTANSCVEAGAKVSRQDAKPINFGLVYGLVLSTFIEMFGEEIGRKVHMALTTRFKGMEDYREACTYQHHLDGFTRTILGRKRRSHDINHESWSIRSHAERQLFNAKIQGSGADVVKLAQIVLARKIPEARQNLQVHDEIHFQFKGTKKQALECAQEIKREMEGVMSLNVPLICDPQVAMTWADAK